MKVKCKVNNVYKITDSTVRNRVENYKDEDNGEIYLDVGKIYTVYGVVISNNVPLFLLCTEINEEYPIPFDPAFFEIVDGRFSSFWRLSFFEYEENKCSTSIVFEEWANNPMFFEKLLDGEPEEVATFSRYRKLMDEEFIDKNLIEKEIQIGLTGEIIEGENKGRYIQINEDNKLDGGLFLKIFSNLNTIDSPVFEDWFETYGQLENFFRQHGWKVNWFTCQ